ncbi:MAG: thermonuclease family protein [Anaerolineae bacterium]
MRLIQSFLTVLIISLLLITGCTLEEVEPGGSTSNTGGETGRVTNIVDGDTIDVVLNNGQEVRVRYVGVNTPERQENCYSDARRANAALVEGETVRLVRDTSDTDRFDRLLRYVYVGETFVNAELVRGGWAEVVRYDPDDREFDNFRILEQDAERAGLGCHPTGIFDDGTFTR